MELNIEKRLRDEEILEKVVKPEELEKQEDPKTLAEIYKAIYLTLETLVDVRKFMRKIYKNTNRRRRNVVTDPTKAKKDDIVVGNEK